MNEYFHYFIENGVHLSLFQQLLYLLLIFKLDGIILLNFAIYHY